VDDGAWCSRPSIESFLPPLRHYHRAVIAIHRIEGLLMVTTSRWALCRHDRGAPRAALAAGCDMALHCNGNLAEMDAVASAPELSGAPRAPTRRSRRSTRRHRSIWQRRGPSSRMMDGVAGSEARV
jgi:hypothetical protein